MAVVWVAFAIFGLATVGGLAGVVYWWGIGFDEAEALGVATASTDAAMFTSMLIAGLGLVGLAATACIASSRRSRSRQLTPH
jgi:hypothetical protein